MAAPATSKRRPGRRRAFLVFLTLGGISAGLLAQAQTASFTATDAYARGAGTVLIINGLGGSFSISARAQDRAEIR